MKYFIVSLFVILFLGCSGKGEFVYIPTPKVKEVKKYDNYISVKEVVLPFYLQEAKIAYIDGTKIKFYHDYFSDDATEYATKRVIDILKQALSTQKISKYPWADEKGDILEIEIQKFISDQKRVYLVASWKLYDNDFELKASGTFDDKKMIGDKEVISIMKDLFDNFIVDIAKRI
jgi:hypothetical protein